MSPLAVQEKMVVSLDYTVQLADGQVVDSSAGSEPLTYIHGMHMIIPGLEQAITGMQVGDCREVVVSPEEGYGIYVEDAAEWVPLGAFPPGLELAPGMMFQVQDEEGHAIPVYVKEVESDRVLMDYNHPLAGETLYFEVTVVDVRQATPEELAHGHVHHEGGH